MRPAWVPNSRRATLLVLAAVLGLLATGCDAIERGAPAAMFRPASTQADSIFNLSVLLLIIAAIAFVIVEAWLIFNVIRYRNRPEDQVPQTHGNLKLEIGWTAVTSLVVIVVLVLTIQTMFEVTRVRAASVPMQGAFPGDSILLRVVGHQWWWTFELPQLNIVTANEVHVPVERTVRVQLEAEDVIHSFWAPRLGGKTDTIPGKINFMSFLAVTPDRYIGICGEFCGLQHAHMGFVIQADPVDEFSDWVRTMQQPAQPPQTPEAQAGLETFMQTCAPCHAIAGTDAQGTIGPNLSHFALRGTIGAAIAENTPENLAAWIDDPQAIKPGNRMPDTGLDQQAIDNVVAYLMGLQ